MKNREFGKSGSCHKGTSPAPHCEGPLDLLVYPQPMTLRPVCIAQLVYFVFRFAAKAAAPAPHCEGPQDLLMYPQPRRRLRLAQIQGASLPNSRFFILFVYNFFSWYIF